MGVNSSIEGSNPSFSVAHPSPAAGSRPAEPGSASPDAAVSAASNEREADARVPSRCARPLRGTGSSPPRLLVPLRPSCASAAPSHHHPFGVDELASLDQGIPRDARRPDGKVRRRCGSRSPHRGELRPRGSRRAASLISEAHVSRGCARRARRGAAPSPRRRAGAPRSRRPSGRAPCRPASMPLASAPTAVTIPIRQGASAEAGRIRPVRVSASSSVGWTTT